MMSSTGMDSAVIAFLYGVNNLYKYNDDDDIPALSLT